MMAYMDDRHRVYRFTDWGLSRGRDGICPTLLDAMGSPYERIPFFYDDYSVRKITQKEAARLQGFPESFNWPIQRTPKQVYKQIGNSVCVPIVKEIADNNYSYRANSNEDTQQLRFNRLTQHNHRRQGKGCNSHHK